jgi:hypothetical protein
MPETSNFNLEKNAASKVYVDLKSYKCIHSEKSCSQMFRKKQHVNNNHLYPCKRCWEAYYRWKKVIQNHQGDGSRPFGFDVIKAPLRESLFIDFQNNFHPPRLLGR